VTARNPQMARLYCQNISTSQVHSSPITHHPSRITHHPSPITHHASPITHHPSITRSKKMY
jgi:hypothetical protein